MTGTLLKSASFICLIALGYLLKHKGMFGKTDYKILSKIVLNVTLPCATIVSFASYTPDTSLLLVVFLGFAMNCLMLLLAFLASKPYPRPTRAIWLNCVPGFNIGTFALPFVQSFLSPAALVGTCLFNTGNALMCNGTTFAISKNILDGSKGLNLKRIGKTLLHSVPFLTHSSLLVFSLIGLRIPQPVVTFVTPAANANAFLAMFMIGTMFDLHIEKSQLKELGGIFALRYSIAFVAAAAFYFLLPLPLAIRQALAITALAPIGTVSTALAVNAGGDPAVAASANSVSVLISVPCMLGLLAVFGAV
ncbi:MAG: AEC family transporter [Oscillospiraceae bacterium]|nr:AEC family transporter [Oscillospiraceae bacterium]